DRRDEGDEKWQAVGKVTLMSSRVDYMDRKGIKREGEEMDVVIGMMSMEKGHEGLGIRGGVCRSGGMVLEDRILCEF
ncbi:PrpF domain-containing protein, partial [Bacillus velezensis]|uniref:PrpF domain-containing protein n=1 Tax=Bacillus velezensis TaxID=492670 RepID=UPI0028D8D23E